MTTAADLRPHRWSDVEKKSYNAAVAFNRDGDTIGMRAFLRALPHEALVDLKYQLPVLLATVRDLVDNEQSLTPQEHKASSVDGSSRAFVREQYGPHRLVRSPDGGCKLCPLSVADEIHADGPAHNPCTRCGHDQPRRCAGDDVPPGRFCLDCPDMTCQPRRVPVGAAQTVTVTDGEEVVE